MVDRDPVRISENLVSEGRTSTYYFDFGKIFEAERGEELVGLVADRIKFWHIKADHIAGHYLVRVAPEEHHKEYPLLSAVSEKLGLPFSVLYEHQDGSPLDMVGETPKGRVLVLTDVVRTGTTLLRYTNYLRDYYPNVDVNHAFTVVVGPSGCKRKDLMAQMRQNSIDLNYFVTAQDLLSRLHRKGYIDDQQLRLALTDGDFDDLDSPPLYRLWAGSRSR